jgi:hypothetical protein
MSYYVLYFDNPCANPVLEGAHLTDTEAKKLFERVAFFEKCHQGDDTARLSDDGKSVELCQH